MSPRRSQLLVDPVERFTQAADAWGAAMAKNDSRTANKYHDRDIIPSLRAVIIAGPEQIGRVVELADDPNPSIAGWAAVFALRYDAARAERALERLASHPSLYIGFDAEMTLKEWRKGTLEVAWEEKV